jgi:type IV pilus assembly protein PilO
MKFGCRELLLIVLLLAIPVGAYFWVFEPARENTEKLKTDLEVKSKKMSDLSKALSGVKDLNAEVDRLSEAISFFEGKLPDHHQIHKVLEQVTKIADDHRLETRLFKTLKPKPFAGYNEQPIKMEVYGDFDAYYQFLLSVEKLPRITKIMDMDLKKDLKNEGAMEADFTLSIFFDNKANQPG